MYIFLQLRLYLLHRNFIKLKVLKQFRIFNGLITRFLNAKFLKAAQEKEIPVTNLLGRLIRSIKNLPVNILLIFYWLYFFSRT